MDMLNHKEEELSALLLIRDIKVIGMLYDEYSPVLYGVILKIVKSQKSAEQVIQEAFVKIWEGAEHHKNSKCQLFTWLINIARKTAIEHIRSSDGNMEQLESKISSETKIGTQRFFDNPEVGPKKLLKSKLIPDSKAIIDLIYFSGYTYEEIAEEIGLPKGEVNKRVRMAMIQLREVMAA